MRAEVIASPVHSAHAVGVSISHQANVMRMLSEERGAAGIILFNRLRIDAPEKSVMLSIKGGHSATRARQDFIKTSRANSEQGVVCESDPGPGDQFEIDKFFESRVMVRPHILHLDALVFQLVCQQGGLHWIAVQE